MKVLFLGGTGRISKDVASLALSKNCEVYIFTRGSDARKRYVDPSYHLIYGDIYNVEDAKNKLQEHKFDVVADFLTFNVPQLKQKLVILEGKFRQYIFVSSATVYKNEDGFVISEDNTPVGNNKWKYAYDKFLCEKYLEEYFDVHNDAYYTIVRPYVTYGNTRFPYPIIPQNSLMEWTLIDRMLKGLPVIQYDNGLTKTTLTHTKDFAIGFVGLFGNIGARNEAFHITNPTTVTWHDVLLIIQKILNIQANIIDLPKEKIYQYLPEFKDILLGDKARDTIFSDEKLKRVVPEFECNITLADGLQDTVQYYIDNPEIQLIDYIWNGRVDRALIKNGISISVNYKFNSIGDRFKYYIGRNIVLYKTYHVTLRILGKCRRLMKRK